MPFPLRIVVALAGLPVLLAAGASAWAEGAPASAVEVTADHSLEWYQDKQLYVARGNAKAVRGDTVLEADTLTAHARDKAKAKPQKSTKSGDIDLITAEGQVRITTPHQKLFGDKGAYDLDKGVAILTGQNLRCEMEKEVVTARDSLEYQEASHQAIARGKAVATGQDRRVEADILIAQFREEQVPQNSTTGGASRADMKLSQIKADGHVVVHTKSDVSRGDHGIYDMDRNVATLTGHVMITRADGTQLSGDKGEVDFTTNESRLLNNGKTGRVRALLPMHSQGGR